MALIALARVSCLVVNGIEIVRVGLADSFPGIWESSELLVDFGSAALAAASTQFMLLANSLVRVNNFPLSDHALMAIIGNYIHDSL